MLLVGLGDVWPVPDQAIFPAWSGTNPDICDDSQKHFEKDANTIYFAQPLKSFF